MAMPILACPHCGAVWRNGNQCEQDFYQMLYWENEYPGHGIVHHLAVLCYYLQHPHLYSPETLRDAMDMLQDFVDRGVTPQEMRKQIDATVDSGKRTHKIKGTPERSGEYAHPVVWTMTAADVVANGADLYIESVRRWAQQVLTALKESGNLPSA